MRYRSPSPYACWTGTDWLNIPKRSSSAAVDHHHQSLPSVLPMLPRRALLGLHAHLLLLLLFLPRACFLRLPPHLSLRNSCRRAASNGRATNQLVNAVDSLSSLISIAAQVGIAVVNYWQLWVFMLMLWPHYRSFLPCLRIWQATKHALMLL